MALAAVATIPGAIVMLLALFTGATTTPPRRTSLRNGLPRLSVDEPVIQTSPRQQSQPEHGAALVQSDQAPPKKGQPNGKPRGITKRNRKRALPVAESRSPKCTFSQSFPERLDNDTFPDGDETGVFIWHVDQIPKVNNACRGELFYLEAPISIVGPIDTSKMSLYHSGIGVSFGEDEYAVQWYAKEGVGNAVFPDANGVWNNEAVLVLSPLIDRGYWTKGQTKVGDITGAMWNKHAEFLVSYAKEHRGYQLFSVVFNEEVAIPESVCDTFSEASLLKFRQLGEDLNVEMNLVKVPLRRNYVTLNVKEQPTLVTTKDKTRVKEALQFYKKVQEALASSLLATGFTMVRFFASYVKGLFTNSGEMFGFVGSPLSGGVYRVVFEGAVSLKLDYANMVIG